MNENNSWIWIALAAVAAFLFFRFGGIGGIAKTIAGTGTGGSTSTGGSDTPTVPSGSTQYTRIVDPTRFQNPIDTFNRARGR